MNKNKITKTFINEFGTKVSFSAERKDPYVILRARDSKSEWNWEISFEEAKLVRDQLIKVLG